MMDITGSMRRAIDAACAKVIEVADGLRGMCPELRLGFLGYRDIGDAEEVERLREALNSIFTTIGVVAALLLTMDQTG